MTEQNKKVYVATIKVVIDANDYGLATRLIHHHLNGKLGVLDWGFADQSGQPYNLPAGVARAFPYQVVLPDDFLWIKAEIKRLENQRYHTERTEKELCDLQMAYEDAFDQLGDSANHRN